MLLLILLFLTSGATGLVYELIWTRELVFVFGGTTYAITTVLVAFMGGLGLGSYLAGRWAGRVRRPGLAYGLLELFIGLYALAVPAMLDAAEPLYRQLYPLVAETPGLLNAARFIVGAVLLVLPTTAMGATLPILVRYISATESSPGRAVGLLYGINTLGAMVGVLASGFVLIPVFGLAQATRIAAASNLLIGLIALAALRRQVPVATPAPATARSAATGRAVLVTCAASGFVAMAYQIAWTRALVMSLGSSTYSFTCILAAFILGLAVGSLVAARFVDRLRQPLTAIGWAQTGIGLAAALVLPVTGAAPILVYWLVERFAQNYDLLLAAQFTLVIAVTFVPTFLLGLLFPLFARVLATEAGDDASAATGRLYGVNTIGTILGSFLAGFVLIRLLGAQPLIVFGTLVNAGLGVWLLRRTRAPRASLAIVAAVATLAIGLTIGRWDPYVLSSGPFIAGFDPRRLADRVELLSYQEGVDMTVSVTRAEVDPGLISLRVNAKTDASTSLPDMTTQLVLGHLPLLLHPDPQQVCVIGLGSGMTLGAVTEHVAPTRIDSVEISAIVIDAAEQHFSSYNNNATRDPRVRMLRADGRNHLLLTDATYDVIISVPSNPWIAGVANLFTREYFELCRAHLGTDGILAFWMQGYMMPVDNFRTVVRTLQQVFPHTSLWEMGDNDYLVLASADMPTPDFSALGERCAGNVQADLFRIALAEPEQLLGRFVTGTETLRTWAGQGILHTDDNALLEFSAPRYMFSERGTDLRRALYGLMQSPLGQVCRLDRPDPAAGEVRARIAGIQDARRALAELAYDPETASLTPDELLDRLLAAHAADPDSVHAYQALNTLASRVAEDPSAIARIRAVRPPFVALRETQTLEQVVRQLRDRGNRYGAEAHWSAAVADYALAYRLAPDQAPVAINYAVALMNADQPGQAVRVLQQGVARDLFTPEQLAASQTFAPLREHEDFRQLVGP